MKKNLVLLGMMAVGKTTLGRMVAKNHNLEFIDTDTFIKYKYFMNIRDIFKKKGEKFFRNEEKKEVLKQLKKNNCIIALGGGAFINKTVRKNILKNAISIWLDVDIKILIERSKWSRRRPLLNEGNSQNWLIMPFYQSNPYEDITAENNKMYEKPSSSHWLGTDNTGRDVFARLCYAFNISISFALLLTVLNYLIGVSIGGAMGYFGGKFDLPRYYDLG